MLINRYLPIDFYEKFVNHLLTFEFYLVDFKISLKILMLFSFNIRNKMNKKMVSVIIIFILLNESLAQCKKN